jgi:hypothetical protein
MNPQMQQPNMSLQVATRPYVAFERRGIEFRDDNGMVGVREIDFVKITPMGSKDIFEKSALEWLQNLREKVRMGIESLDNQLYYEKLYEYWKKGEELPVEGTPIKGWPLATMAEQSKCIQLHVLTVEGLAACNQETVTRLGMGGQMLRNRANDWLKTKNETGPIVARVESQQLTIENLMKRLETLEAENRVLKDIKGIASVHPVAPLPVGYTPPRVAEAPEVDTGLIGDALEDAMDDLTVGHQSRQDSVTLEEL